ncbi:hypothetical protein Agub_g13370 [Astrephomene gubernaculifera]|uniref:Uncharacterized protein n=1 Tax=Astrephomene gubernaculifera TaxID=47775 RepID=A0AAD3DZP1_9CHLO|nr:hypothetical protein Agub_g13370 [Astrephomene gubernaculifera]
MANMEAAAADGLKGLQDLGIDAMEHVFRYVVKGDYSAFRQACRAGRLAVDSNITKVTINLLPEDLQECYNGKLLCLSERFTKLTFVRLTFQMGQGVTVSDAVLVATQLFKKLNLESRQRITRLELVQDRGVVAECAEMVVEALAQLLPGLQELDIQHFHGMSCIAPYQSDMYGTLAACLPQLQALSLPSWLTVAELPVLAQKGLHLSYLELSGGTRMELLEASVITTIAQLTALRELRLTGFVLNGPMSVQLLCRMLPASLQRLRMQSFLTTWGAHTLHARLDAGRMVAVDLLESNARDLEGLVKLSRALSYMSDGGLPQEQEPLLQQGELRVAELTLMEVRQLEEVQLERLWELRRWFARPRVGCMTVSGTTTAVVTQVIELLGMPEEFSLGLQELWVEVSTGVAGCHARLLSAEHQQQQLLLKTSEPHAGDGTPPLQLPSAAALTSEVVSRFTAGPARTSETVAEVAARTSDKYFLVRGRAVSRARVNDLLKGAQLFAGVPCQKAESGIRVGGMAYYGVACDAGRAADIAAAAEVLVRARLLACRMEVLRVDSRYDIAEKDVVVQRSGLDPIHVAFEEVLQEAWDASQASGHPCSWRQQVEWLVGLQQEMNCSGESDEYTDSEEGYWSDGYSSDDDIVTDSEDESDADEEEGGEDEEPEGVGESESETDSEIE